MPHGKILEKVKVIRNRKLTFTLLAAFGLLCFLLSAAAFLIPYLKAVSPLFKGSGKVRLVPQIIRITAYTFEEAILSTALAALIGIPAAYFVSKKRFFGRSLLRSFGAVPLCIPPLIVALAYISTFGMNGIFNRILMQVFSLKEAPFPYLYSFAGVVLTQGFYNFPLVMISVADRWSTVDKSQENAARLLGTSSSRIFFTITLRQIAPAIISGCIPVFIFCFFSFMIVLLFGSVGGTTLELAIFHAGRIELDFQKVAFLSVIETLSVLILLSLWEYAGKKSEHNDSVSLEKNYAVKKFSAKESVFFAALIFLIAVFFVLPLLSVFISSFVSKKGALTFDTWKSLFSSRGFPSALRNTLVCAFFTATLCTATGFFYSAFLRFSPLRKNVLARLIPILPAAVSSVTIGIGMRAAFPHGSFLMLIASQTALSWPFAYRQIHPHVCAVPGNVIDSARLFSQNPLDSIFRIVLPYSKRGILSAFGLSFAISSGDATLPLVLGVQGFDTLSLFTYRLAGAYRFAQASASGLLLGFLCALVFALSKISLKNRGKSSNAKGGNEG